MARRLSFLDWSFWLTETKHNPKHVAAFQILTKPEGASSDYCAELVKDAKKHNQAFFPFNSRILSVWRFALGFKKVESLDMDYHVKHHKIKDISDRNALHQYAARLHEPMLDRDKPLWQMHVIEGEQGDKFAIFFTIHHLYADGASMMKWLQECYQTSPSEVYAPAWSIARTKRKKVKKNPILSVFNDLWRFTLTVFDIGIILFRLLLKLLRIYPVYMPLPFSGTKSILTGQVSSGRVIATTSIDFNELKDLSKRLRASINEVLLCCFDIGIHKFLNDHGQTFEKPLLTQMPVNMRRPNDPVGGNRIAIVPVQLAYGKKDPYLRLRQIIENHRIVKGVGKRVYPAAFTYYTILIQGCALIFEVFKLSSFFKPLGSMLISNMNGPNHALYCKDSHLDALYPVSTLTSGGGVNITLLTYNGKADIGLVCCNKYVDSLEPVAEYFNEAFEQLKRCVDDPSIELEDLGELGKRARKSVLTEMTHAQAAANTARSSLDES